MKISKKEKRDEIKRMQASFNQLNKKETKIPNLKVCLKCKQDPKNNFKLIYKRNNELKGKMCLLCYQLSYLKK